MKCLPDAVDSVALCSWGWVLTTPETCRAVIRLIKNSVTSASSWNYIPNSYRDFSRTPFVSNSPLRVAWFKRPVATAKAAFSVAGFMTIFGHAWGLWQCPVMSLNPKFWCYITRRFGSLGGHSWSSLAEGNAVRTHRQNFFVWLKSLYEPNFQII